MGTLYLIPTTLGGNDLSRVTPDYNNHIIKNLKYFIVENIRSARRFLKSVDSKIIIDELHFYELNKNSNPNIISSFLNPIYNGFSVGIVSDAGCPAIADPGSDIVEIAQSKGIKVIPLVGASSIVLSLMASGFNGQSFTFNGYLPINTLERTQKLKQLENRMIAENQTQIFIETPYRNNQMFNDIKETLKPTTKLCIASEVTNKDEFIKTLSINNWKKEKIDINKKPTIFLIYK